MCESEDARIIWRIFPFSLLMIEGKDMIVTYVVVHYTLRYIYEFQLVSHNINMDIMFELKKKEIFAPFLSS